MKNALLCIIFICVFTANAHAEPFAPPWTYPRYSVVFAPAFNSLASPGASIPNPARHVDNEKSQIIWCGPTAGTNRTAHAGIDGSVETGFLLSPTKTKRGARAS